MLCEGTGTLSIDAITRPDVWLKLGAVPENIKSIPHGRIHFFPKTPISLEI